MFIDTLHIQNTWSFLDQGFPVKGNSVRKVQRPLEVELEGALAAPFLGWKQHSQRGAVCEG